MPLHNCQTRWHISDNDLIRLFKFQIFFGAHWHLTNVVENNVVQIVVSAIACGKARRELRETLDLFCAFVDLITKWQLGIALKQGQGSSHRNQ